MIAAVRRALCIVMMLGVWASGARADEAPDLARTRELRRAGTIALEIENLLDADLTVTVRLDEATSVSADRPVPTTFTLGPHATRCAFRLSLPRDDRRWSYRYSWHARIGNAKAVHDEHTVYALPYASGATFPVLQSFHGSFSHTGADAFAIDWQMPEGTEVRAARDGTVVYVVDRYTVGGTDRSLRSRANEVLVRHADGTCGQYVHLRRGGVRVSVGDPVRVGDVIGLSGNTGFSSEPHLHFMVLRPIDGYEVESLPIRFRVSGNPAPVVPREGESCTAP